MDYSSGSQTKEGQNIELCRDSRTTSANLADHLWSEEQTSGITGLPYQGPLTLLGPFFVTNLLIHYPTPYWHNVEPKC